MRYFITYEDGSLPTDLVDLPRAITRLGPGEDSDSIALACRSAALSFMSGVSAGWGKLELVMWLTYGYAHATRFVMGRERPLELGAEIAPVDVELLRRVLDNARMHVLALAEELAVSRADSDSVGREPLVDDAITRGLVAKVQEPTRGAMLWAPVDRERMLLRDRVRSLFIVDYLLSPKLYATDFFVCGQRDCERVSFDADAKRLGQCSLHRKRSGIVAKNAGEGAAEAESESPGETPDYDDSTFGQAG